MTPLSVGGVKIKIRESSVKNKLDSLERDMAETVCIKFP